MEQAAKRLVVKGRVQGVFYRAWTVETARDLGLTGWVRNLRDGSVEIEAFGEKTALEQLIERCRKGPPAAQVTHVVEAPAEGHAPDGFEQRMTL